MSQRAKRIIIAVALIQVLVIIGLMALPGVVLAIPGAYRVYLADRSPFLSQIAESVIEQVSPVEDVLPAPDVASERPQITIPALIPEDEPTIIIEPSLTPTVTPVPETTEVIELAAVATDPPTPTQTPLPTATATPEPLPTFVRLEGLHRIQQSFNNCGPANLTQVLNWYGDETTQSQAASYLKPNPEDRNVSPWQLSDYVNEFTSLSSTAHSGGNLELLKRFVAAGYPVVIEKGYEPNTTNSLGWFGHYLTVFGYDEEKQEFYSMDSFLPVDEKTGRADSFETIDEYWKHFNRTFYVVHEPDQTTEVESFLGADLLDPMTMWEKAAIQAQSEIDANPEDVFAWFNLGTSLTRLGELTGKAEFYENGAAAYDEARTIGLPPRKLWYEFRPYIAYMKVGRFDDMLALADAILATQGGQNVVETFLYKGHALLFQGDVAGAADSYERALELNENFYPAQIALQSIS